MTSDKTIQFLEKLKEIGNYNENYDYSKFEFKKLDTKSIIKDEIGFNHEVLPSSLLKGLGLNAHNVIDKSGYFIYKFKKVHGDLYDYSNTKYINADTGVKIYCKKHKIEFEQTPGNHLIGRGCSICGREKTDKKRLKTSKLENLKNKYPEIDFSKSIYKSTVKKILVTDKNGLDYLISPSKLELDQALCLRNCTDKTKYFIIESNKTHENKYDYSKSKYINSNELIEIICSTHGSFFQKPSQHISGNGCAKCSGSVKKTTEQFISESVEIHGDKYDYSRVKYTGAWEKVEIICKEHGTFLQAPVNHTNNSQGCPICGIGHSLKYKLSVLNDLEKTDLLTMDPVELLIIIGQGKFPEEFKSLTNTDAKSEERIATIEDLKKEFSKNLQTEDKDNNEQSKNNNVNPSDNLVNSVIDNRESIDDVEQELLEVKSKKQLPEINNISEFHSLDGKFYSTMDEEAINSLIQFRVQKMRNLFLNSKLDINPIKNETGGKYFTLIKNFFLSEYEDAMNLIIPNEFSHPEIKIPNLMQRIVPLKVLKQRSFLNFSDTGAGKTISMILSTRLANSKITLLVTPNSLVKQWKDEIMKSFPDSLVFTEHTIGKRYDINKHNYLILNYEKFQLKYSESLYQDLTNNNKVDFFGFDELQNVKQRGENESIRRSVLMRLLGRIRDKNQNLYTLGMTATPVINDLTEAISLLEILTGKSFSEFKTNKSVENALRIYQQFLIHGIRYTPDYNIELNQTFLEVDGSELIQELTQLDKKNFIGLEKLLVDKKLESIESYLESGVCIFTYYTTGFVKKICNLLDKKNLTYVLYTGEVDDTLEIHFDEEESKRYGRDIYITQRQKNLKQFINGEVDIIIGSRPITTGVDGLQYVCNRLIPISLPWTSSERTQLFGRFNRQGSNFSKIEVIIPQVVIELEDKKWSWDKQRLNIIENKKTIADCVVDGKIPSKLLPSSPTLCKKSLESLDTWLHRLNDGKVIQRQRNDIVIDLYPELDTESKKQKINSELSNFNQRGKTTLSSTMNKEFNSNPDSWFRYHYLRRESIKDWEEIPYEYIATKIKNKNHKVVDFGCGENKFKNCIPNNEVISFDHIAIDDSVIACDMSDVSGYLKDESMDFAVFSLALWGTNYKDYIKEAYRILNWGGNIYIAEPAKKYKTEEDEQILVNLIKEFGFEIIGDVEKRNKFIYIRGIK